MRKWWVALGAFVVGTTMSMQAAFAATEVLSAADGIPAENPLFYTVLNLPNGQAVMPDHATRWKDLDVSLLVSSLPGNSGYPSITGNHSEILSHRKVSTSAGSADLVLNERTPPAAAGSTKATYEYWVIVDGPHYAYAIDAIVTGKRSAAKAEVLSFLKGWYVGSTSGTLGLRCLMDII
ncbi:MAG: hypothetical protein K6T83_01885 [Alicyclobacillus sp.]|nr:hypothetical protein [Alicyclobacillus sp.]